MKFSPIIGIICLFVSSNILFCEKQKQFDPFVYVPENSFIKKECKACGFGGFFYSNKKQKGCAYIRDTLAKFNEPDPEPGFLGLFIGLLIGPNGRSLMTDLTHMANTKEMKQHVFAVLGEKYTKEQMRNEHNLLAEAAEYIYKTRQERKKQAEKIRQEAAYKKQYPKDPY